MRLCVLCKRCAFDSGNVSKEQRGAPSIRCGAGVHRAKEWPDRSAPFIGQREFLEWNSFAACCKHYDPVA